MTQMLVADPAAAYATMSGMRRVALVLLVSASGLAHADDVNLLASAHDGGGLLDGRERGHPADMTDKPTLEELNERIGREKDHFGGVLPERVAIAWDGYLAALIEWGLVSPAEHKILSGLLPEIVDNPVMAILLGRD